MNSCDMDGGDMDGDAPAHAERLMFTHHLYLLNRRADLNGCPARPLATANKGDQSIAVEVMSWSGTLVRVRAKGSNLGRRASDAQVASVLGDADLSLLIVSQLMEAVVHRSMGLDLKGGSWQPPRPNRHFAPDLSVIPRIACVTRALAIVTASDAVWKQLCIWRWQCKWGFAQRLRLAAEEVRTELDGTAGGWRARYQLEEGRGKQEGISAQELSQLHFDFRFWLRGPWNTSEPFDSGLFVSHSRCCRLLSFEEGDASPDAVLNAREYARTYAKAPWEAGRLLGHPNGDEPQIVWILDADGCGIQWGYAGGHLWPKGTVQRTPAWGWQICNPNVVMRALEPGSLEPDSKDDLWADLLDSLVLVQARGAHLPGGKGMVRVPAAGIPGLSITGRFG